VAGATFGCLFECCGTFHKKWQNAMVTVYKVTVPTMMAAFVVQYRGRCCREAFGVAASAQERLTTCEQSFSDSGWDSLPNHLRSSFLPSDACPAGYQSSMNPARYRLMNHSAPFAVPKQHSSRLLKHDRFLSNTSAATTAEE